MKDLTKNEIKYLKVCIQWCIEELEQDRLSRWLVKMFPRVYSYSKERIEIIDKLKTLKRKIRQPIIRQYQRIVE